jgi:hypothetical protein
MAYAMAASPARGPRMAPPASRALAGLAVAALVLLVATGVGWGLIWLLVPVLLIARRPICGSGH